MALAPLRVRSRRPLVHPRALQVQFPFVISRRLDRRQQRQEGSRQRRNKPAVRNLRRWQAGRQGMQCRKRPRLIRAASRYGDHRSSSGLVVRRRASRAGEPRSWSGKKTLPGHFEHWRSGRALGTVNTLGEGHESKSAGCDARGGGGSSSSLESRRRPSSRGQYNGPPRLRAMTVSEKLWWLTPFISLPEPNGRSWTFLHDAPTRSIAFAPANPVRAYP